MIIPFSLLPLPMLKKLSKAFLGIASGINKSLPLLQMNLTRSNFELNGAEYISYCLASLSFLFVNLSLVFAMLMDKYNVVWVGIVIAFFLCTLIFVIQLNYPAIEASRRIKKVDLELLASLRTMIIQLNSGLPLFNAMVTISKQDFGEVRACYKIN